MHPPAVSSGPPHSNLASPSTSTNPVPQYSNADIGVFGNLGFSCLGVPVKGFKPVHGGPYAGSVYGKYHEVAKMVAQKQTTTACSHKCGTRRSAASKRGGHSLRLLPIPCRHLKITQARLSLEPKLGPVAVEARKFSYHGMAICGI